eukprot:gene38761-50937_t
MDSSSPERGIVVTIYVNGSRCVRSSITLPSLSESDLSCTWMELGPDLSGSGDAWRITELRMWADVRGESDLEAQRVNYLPLASKQKRLKSRIKGAKHLFGPPPSSLVLLRGQGGGGQSRVPLAATTTVYDASDPFSSFVSTPGLVSPSLSNSNVDSKAMTMTLNRHQSLSISASKFASTPGGTLPKPLAAPSTNSSAGGQVLSAAAARRKGLLHAQSFVPVPSPTPTAMSSSSTSLHNASPWASTTPSTLTSSLDFNPSTTINFDLPPAVMAPPIPQFPPPAIPATPPPQPVVTVVTIPGEWSSLYGPFSLLAPVESPGSGSAGPDLNIGGGDLGRCLRRRLLPSTSTSTSMTGYNIVPRPVRLHGASEEVVLGALPVTSTSISDSNSTNIPPVTRRAKVSADSAVAAPCCNRGNEQRPSPTLALLLSKPPRLALWRWDDSESGGSISLELPMSAPLVYWSFIPTPVSVQGEEGMPSSSTSSSSSMVLVTPNTVFRWNPTGGTGKNRPVKLFERCDVADAQ